MWNSRSVVEFTEGLRVVTLVGHVHVVEIRDVLRFQSLQKRGGIAIERHVLRVATSVVRAGSAWYVIARDTLHEAY